MKHVLISTLAVTAALLGACNKSDNAASSLSLKSYTYDVTVNIQDAPDIGLEGYSLTRLKGIITLPEMIDGKDAQLLRDTLCSMAQVILEKDNLKPKLDSTENVAANQNVEACGFRLERVIVSLVTPYVIVWEHTEAAYPCGAAHSMYSTNCINYARQSEKILSLSDILTPKGRTELTAMLRSRLADSSTDLLVDPATVELPDKFRITSSGIDLIFGLYTIAPFSSGEITISFTLSELFDVLTPKAYELLGAPTI